jgi:hypothetical protein
MRAGTYSTVDNHHLFALDGPFAMILELHESARTCPLADHEPSWSDHNSSTVVSPFAYFFLSQRSWFVAWEATMQQQQRSVSADLDAYEAVFTVLAKYRPGSILSTRDVLADIRQLCPSCEHTDEELVGFVVETLTGQTIGVCFDHRDGA